MLMVISQRILDSEQGQPLVEWLNGLPKVQAVLQRSSNDARAEKSSGPGGCWALAQATMARKTPNNHAA